MTATERALALLEKWEGQDALREVLPDIAAAIREAVEAERERCARVAEEWVKRDCVQTDDGWAPYPDAGKIAAAIREGKA